MNSGHHDATQPSLGVQELPSQNKMYGGIRRREYFFRMFGVGVLSTGLGVVAQGEPHVAIVSLISAVVLYVVVIVSRLHNIGMSGWWSLLTFVPVANLILGVRCLMMPEGYQDTKKLDNAAKIILRVVICLAVLVAVGLGILFTR